MIGLTDIQRERRVIAPTKPECTIDGSKLGMSGDFSEPNVLKYYFLQGIRYPMREKLRIRYPMGENSSLAE